MSLSKKYSPARTTVVRYTEGDCWYLAIVLSQMTGRDIAVLSYSDDAYDWCHVGIVLPNGNVLDIEGQHTTSDWLSRWKSICGAYCYRHLGPVNKSIEHFSDNDSMELLDFTFQDTTRSGTQRVARKLLEAHAPELIGV